MVRHWAQTIARACLMLLQPIERFGRAANTDGTYERVFERMALSCGKIDATEEQCSIQASSS